MHRAPLLVLVGPAAAGKSTLGRLVGEDLGAAFVDLDDVGDRYYAEVGWSIDRLIARIDTVGRVAAEREWEPARAHAVRRVVEDHPDAVVAFGAGHTSFTDPECFAVAADALSRVPYVVRIVPSTDRAQALDELRRRSLATKGTDWITAGHDFLAEWFDDRGARAIATRVVVTDGEAPELTARRLTEMVRPGRDT